MLHFDANPIKIGYLVMKNLSMLKQYQTKESEHCFCLYLKDYISDIRLIPLDHVTNICYGNGVSSQKGSVLRKY